MKKISLLFSLLVLVATSCTPSNEERAEELVSSCIKDYLTYPDSYEAISTVVDSASVDVSKIEETLRYAKEVVEIGATISSIESNMEVTQISLDIYAPDDYFYTEYSRRQYERAEAEMAEYELEMERATEDLQEAVANLRDANSAIYTDEVNGWSVVHRFRSKGDNGEQLPPQEMIFFCDMEFEHCQGWTSRQYELISGIIEDINDSETTDELLDNLEDVRFLLLLL